MSNTKTPRTLDEGDALLSLVDFKWLMAGMGWWINLTRLQRDKIYLEECLVLALASESDLLREHGAELLGVSDCSAPVRMQPVRHATAPVHAERSAALECQ